MKYLLLVHHDEEAFGKFSQTKRQQMLEESVQVTHQLHANGQYLSASPLHPASPPGFQGRASEPSRSVR